MKNIEKLKDIKNANECVGNRCDNSNNWEPNRGTEDDNRSSINNNMNIRIFKYWQEIVATWLLISVGIGTLWYLFKIFGLNGSKDKTVVFFIPGLSTLQV